MEKKRAKLPCAFDKLFTRNVPHILEKIFFSLDFDSFNACHEVSTSWYDLLSSESFKKIGRYLFQQEIESNERDLFDAIRKGKIDVLRRILSYKMVDVKCITKFTGLTPLYLAIRCGGRDEIIEILLKNGADVNEAHEMGWTPLHIVAFYNQTNEIKILLEGGADPNKASEKGKTPLHLAAYNASKEVFQVLLDGGADPEMKDVFGMPPLQYWNMCNDKRSGS